MTSELSIQSRAVKIIRSMPSPADLIFAIANGGKRSARAGAILKRSGVLPGIPDTFLPCARHGYHGFFIEFKDPEDGRLSTDQMKIIPRLQHEGYLVEVCDSIDDATSLVAQYLGLRKV